MMNKIAFVSTMSGAPWGGSEELWSRTARRLLEKRETVGANVVGWPHPVPQLQALRQAGCRIRYRRHLRNAKLQAVNTLIACNWLDRFRPDLVLISQGCQHDGNSWLRACLRRNLRYAVLVQAAQERIPLDAPRVARLARAYQGASACYFVSQANRKLVERQLETELAQAQVVRNPFNVDYDANPPWPSEDDEWKLACVARLDMAIKGQDLLLDVLQKEKWRQRPVRLTFHGSGPDHERLSELKSGRRLENVTLGGFVDDIESIWKTHHALVLPSRFEGLPLAVVEAMLCGRPCVVTDVAGNAELMQDNVSGFVARAPTVSALDEALERAWVRRHEGRQIGQAAARHVRDLVPRDPADAFATQLLGLIRAQP